MSRWDRFAAWTEHVAADPRRRLRVGLVLIALGLSVLGVFHDRIYNGFWGPFALDAKELPHLDGVPLRRFVKLERDGKPMHLGDLIDTGEREERYGRRGSHTVAAYLVLAIDGRRVIVRVEEGGTGDVVTGILREREPDQYQLRGDDERVKVYLDCTKTRFRWWALGAAAFGALAVLLGLDQVRRARKKPEQRGLRRFT